jgi:hypothetical protein
VTIEKLAADLARPLTPEVATAFLVPSCFLCFALPWLIATGGCTDAYRRRHGTRFPPSPILRLDASVARQLTQLGVTTDGCRTYVQDLCQLSCSASPSSPHS